MVVSPVLTEAEYLYCCCNRFIKRLLMIFVSSILNDEATAVTILLCSLSGNCRQPLQTSPPIWAEGFQSPGFILKSPFEKRCTSSIKHFSCSALRIDCLLCFWRRFYALAINVLGPKGRSHSARPNGPGSSAPTGSRGLKARPNRRPAGGTSIRSGLQPLENFDSIYPGRWPGLAWTGPLALGR